MTTDIYEDKMQKAEVFGQPVLFSDKTVARNIVPDGWYCYSLERMEDGPWEEAALVTEDGCHYLGTVLSPAPLMDGESKPLNGQISLTEEETTLAEFCREHGLAYPEDKRAFIFSPDPLADAPPGSEQLLRDTVDAIQKSGLFKELLRDGCEDYYQMELLYILSDPECDAPERISAEAACLNEDGYPDDEMIYRFHPYTDRKPVHLWGANSWRDLYEPLSAGSEILYMSMDCHVALWGELACSNPDIGTEKGVAKYLQYCCVNGITPERIREADSTLEGAVETIAQMLEYLRSPEGMAAMQHAECQKPLERQPPLGGITMQ